MYRGYHVVLARRSGIRPASPQSSPPASHVLRRERGGDGAGEHSLTFAAGAERQDLSHKATDRRTFARSAADPWIASNALHPGGYIGAMVRFTYAM